MTKIKLLAISAVIAVVAGYAGWHFGPVKRYGGGLKPQVIGSNPIPLAESITADDCKTPVGAVMRLHLQKQLFSNLSPDTICDKCLEVGNPAKGGQDDDGTLAIGPFTPTPITGSVHDWSTPLDIDLDKFWNGSNYILIKIILDDPDVGVVKKRFFQRTDPASSTDSSDAIASGDEGSEGAGMFDCLQAIDSDTVKPTSKVLKVRVVNKSILQPPNMHNIGGLNIGVLLQKAGLTMPIVIDPKIREDGYPLTKPTASH